MPHLRHFFVIIILAHWTYLIVAGSPGALPPLKLVNTTANPSHTIQCVNSDRWVTRGFLAYDCFTALATLEDHEVYRHGATVYEFLAANIPPPYPFRFAQTTPRKYSYKSCTTAIVLLADLADLPAGLVPHLPAPPPLSPPPGTATAPKDGAVGAWPRSDMCDYATIERAGLNVRDGCLSIIDGGVDEGDKLGKAEQDQGGKDGGGGLKFANPGGYRIVGMQGAMGVFLWDTASEINLLVRAWVEVVVGTNGSVRTVNGGSGGGASTGAVQ